MPGALGRASDAPVGRAESEAVTGASTAPRAGDAQVGALGPLSADGHTPGTGATAGSWAMRGQVETHVSSCIQPRNATCCPHPCDTLGPKLLPHS